MATLVDKTLEITDRHVSAEGYLHAAARLSRVGVQDYLARELRAGGHAVPSQWPDDAIIRLNRAEDQVFSTEALGSIALKPVTLEHPSSFVDAKNVQKLQVGIVVGEPRRDGDYVVADLLVQDAAAVAEVQRGRRQISLGYNLDIDWTPGLDAKYGPFDGSQINLRTNHVAIVQTGRAGPDAKILDEGKMAENKDMSAVALDAAAKEIVDLRAQLADSAKSIDELKSAADKAAGERAALEAEVAKLRELSAPAALDAAVSSRLALIDSARKIAKDVDFAGKSPREIKVAALMAWNKDCAIDGKSDDYVDGVFSVAVTAPVKSKALDAALVATAKDAGEIRDARSEGLKKLAERSAKKLWDK